MKVVLQNLTKIFPNRNKKQPDVIAVNDFTFEVPDGKLVGLLGPSGCGKSTALNLLCGLLNPTSGKIYFGEDDVTTLPAENRGVGMVFQNYALFPNMNVLENVEYALKLQPETKTKAREIAMKTLEQVDLIDQMNKKPNQLSGGQQQRVAIARTLATNPDIILLDEPISALDVSNRENMKKELKAIQKKFNATMLFITHDQEEAFFLSDRIMVMNAGNIEQIASPLELYKNPANTYVKEFVVDQLDKKYFDMRRYTGRDE